MADRLPVPPGNCIFPSRIHANIVSPLAASDLDVLLLDVPPTILIRGLTATYASLPYLVPLRLFFLPRPHVLKEPRGVREIYPRSSPSSLPPFFGGRGDTLRPVFITMSSLSIRTHSTTGWGSALSAGDVAISLTFPRYRERRDVILSTVIWPTTIAPLLD